MPTSTAWTQRLNKPELMQLLGNYGIDTSGTIDDLRRRLREFIRDNPGVITPPGAESLGTPMSSEHDGLPVKAGPSTEPRPAFEPIITPASPLPPSISVPEPARVLDQIRKWGCHFDGRDPAMFLERVEELKRGYYLTDAHLLLGLPELLRGAPLLWA